MSKFLKKNLNSNLKYRQYVQKSVQNKTKNIVVKMKKKDSKHDKAIMKHISDYENTNQTIIGSHLFTLLYQSRHEPEKYMQTRIQTLRILFDFINSNQCWYDLWKTVTLMESNVYKKQGVVEHNLYSEIDDMLRLFMPYPQWIIGIDADKKPIFERPLFYYTDRVIDMLFHNKSIGRKKTKELKTIQYQANDFRAYHVYSYGLYRRETLDLLPKNGMNYDEIANLKFPRKIADTDDLIDFIIQNRQYTMNPNGVVVECYNCGDIEQLIMVEEKGYLLWKAIFKKNGLALNHKEELVQDSSGAEYSGYFNPEFFPRSLFTEHINYIDFEYDLYDFILECYAEIVCGSSLLNEKFNRNVLNHGMVEMLDEQGQSNENKMGLRFIPRKVHQRLKNKTQTLSEYEREIKKYFVAGHIRKLPIGYSASKEAIQHALEFGIEIPEGYTFVRPHEVGDEKIRTRYIKKID